MRSHHLVGWRAVDWLLGVSVLAACGGQNASSGGSSSAQRPAFPELVLPARLLHQEQYSRDVRHCEPITQTTPTADVLHFWCDEQEAQWRVNLLVVSPTSTTHHVLDSGPMALDHPYDLEVHPDRDGQRWVVLTQRQSDAGVPAMVDTVQVLRWDGTLEASPPQTITGHVETIIGQDAQGAWYLQAPGQVAPFPTLSLGLGLQAKLFTPTGTGSMNQVVWSAWTLDPTTPGQAWWTIDGQPSWLAGMPQGIYSVRFDLSTGTLVATTPVGTQFGSGCNLKQQVHQRRALDREPWVHWTQRLNKGCDLYFQGVKLNTASDAFQSVSSRVSDSVFSVVWDERVGDPARFRLRWGLWDPAQNQWSSAPQPVDTALNESIDWATSLSMTGGPQGALGLLWDLCLANTPTAGSCVSAQTVMSKQQHGQWVHRSLPKQGTPLLSLGGRDEVKGLVFDTQGEQLTAIVEEDCTSSGQASSSTCRRWWALRL